MIDDVFITADVTACPEILGVRLRPLSIWHVWALRAEESPFIDGGKLDVEDICRAVMICSLTRSEYATLSASEAITIYLGRIAGRYIEMPADERETVMTAVCEYVNACTTFPEFWSDGKTDPVKDRMRCPFEWHAVAMLLSMRICATEADAWDYPVALAQCWQAVEGERNGSKNYVDPVDRKDFDVLNKEASGNG